MELFTALLTVLDEQWTAPIAILFILVILETERSWVRARRRRGFRYSPLSHMFDALIVLLGLIATAAIVRMILAANMIAFVSLLAPLIWALGLILILAIGIALIRRFGPSPEQSSPSR